MAIVPEREAAQAPSAPEVWDIGRPQPAFDRLAKRGLLSGRVLDVGCGTGEHALLAAARGADATGVDISAQAIARARRKAVERGIAASFEIADALSLWQLGSTFDTVIDVGMFHVFDDDRRARYVTSLGSVLKSGGTCYLLCVSDRQPGDFDRPRRVSQDELHRAFRSSWTVTDIADDVFELNPKPGCATTSRAWLATICRTGPSKARR